jgi:hypothetical protein
MKIALFATVALLGGCVGLQPSNGAPAAGPLWVQRDMALTKPHYVPPFVHSDHGSSWMVPQKMGSKRRADL